MDGIAYASCRLLRRTQVEIAGGSVGGKALMLREPVRRDRIVTILPSGKVGRELVKKRAPPGEANCVVVRHTASDGSKGLHLRAIATMAPGTQLTITFGVGAKISTLRPCH